MTHSPDGAHVEIIDGEVTETDSGTPLCPDRVLVNGVDVGLIAERGLCIEPGDANTAASVTITLLPRRIEIRPADEPTTELHTLTRMDGKQWVVEQDPTGQTSARLAEGGDPA